MDELVITEADERIGASDRSFRLALVSMVLSVGAVLAAVAAAVAVENNRRLVGQLRLDRSGWFWVALALGILALVLAVAAIWARRVDGRDRRGFPWAWVAFALVALATFLVTAMVLLSSGSRVVEGRPRRRRVCGRRATVDLRAGPASALPEAVRASSPAAAMNEVERSFLLDAWTRAARHEAEAVASFRQLGDELSAVGGAPALRNSALEAAADEVEHARLASGVATRLAGPTGCAPPVDRTLGFRTPTAPPRTSLGRRYRVLRLAIEAYVDGCGNEGAEVARLQVAASRSVGAASAALHVIVEDERRHAELAWSTVEWALTEAGPIVGAVLTHLPVPARSRPHAAPVGADEHVLARWGWVDPDTQVRCRTQNRERARRRLAELRATR